MGRITDADADVDRIDAVEGSMLQLDDSVFGSARPTKPATGTIGTIGAAAAAGSMLKLTPTGLSAGDQR